MLNLNQIVQGDCAEVLTTFPANSIDLIFADPPYNLQLENELYRPNQSKVDGVDDHWDKFSSFQEYDDFCYKWLSQCQRVLKDNGTIWVIGSYHNIFRVGKIMQDIGFWILNDIVWIKTNPMPNFKGTRFNNAHETLIWASKNQNSKYTFHYKTMKAYNDDKQMRSDWEIPICSGNERIKVNGEKAHSTQKPIELLKRVILSTSNVGDTILDPFFGSGTTGAVAKYLKRNYIGIEREERYINIAKQRIENTPVIQNDKLLEYPSDAKQPKVPFGNLLHKGFIKAGEILYSKDMKFQAIVLANANIVANDSITGSIHSVSASLLGATNNNGWTFWYVMRDNKLVSIDSLRKSYIKEYSRNDNIEVSVVAG